MIEVRGLRKAYGGRSVLRGVDLRIPKGQLTALIGPNGAGKSTLLMAMARLLEPTSGEILIDERPVVDIRRTAYARLVATLRQSPDFHLRLTVEELVAFGRFPHSQGALTAADRQAVDEALRFLTLEPLRQRPLNELSGGQRQMAFLAMAIAQQTDYLLLDEPLNNLDIRHAVQIMRALRRLCDMQGRTVVLVVHDINFAASHADHIVAMKDGAIHADGPVDAVITTPVLRALYGLDIAVVQGPGGRLCNYFNPPGELT